jgi:signal transduction histidine kinase
MAVELSAPSPEAKMTRQSVLVYGLLVFAWLALVGWQAFEHARVKRTGRSALINRSRDITSTLETVIRSQQRFGVIFSATRLESALNELVKIGEVKSVLLLNASGEVVISAGDPVKPEAREQVHSTGQRWGEHNVALLNQIDLGTNLVRDWESNRPIIVMPPSTNSEWRPPPWNRRRSVEHGPEGTNSTNAIALDHPPEGPPPDRPPPGSTNRPPPFRRPPRMTEEEYQSLVRKQGLQSFVVVMSTEALRAANTYDFWLRSIIVVLGGIASGGFALAWSNSGKSADLQFRLVRASELTNHLREMNIAAAGLAHETRNPLNIIRGLAQIISHQPDASPEVRQKSKAITDEVDRITAQLNEFINYSKPREVRRAPVSLGAVVGEIGRALQYDFEDKAIQFSVSHQGLVVEADEQMLRQLLFNLLLNAIQAVEPKGEIQIVCARTEADEASLEVRDNGPGVPLSQRDEIFKPYFTTHQKGTGLGLAVVQQIVLAHGWEIQCLSNEPKGAIFRLTHLKLCPST